MAEKSFSAVDCISEAWVLVKGTKWPIWSVLLLFVVCRALGFIPFIGIIFIIVAQILVLGVCYLGLLRGQGKDIQFSIVKEVFNFKTILYTIGLYILYLFFSLLMVLPIFLIMHARLPNMVDNVESLLTPTNILFLILVFAWITYAAYLYVRTYLTFPIILLQQKNPWAAMVESYRATQSHVLSLSLLMLLQFIFVFLGAIPLGIGLIWALPLIYISYGVAYKKLVLKA